MESTASSDEPYDCAGEMVVPTIPDGVWVFAFGLVISLTACGSSPPYRPAYCSEPSWSAPSTSHVDCPIYAGCAETYADQVAKARTEAGVCDQFSDTVSTTACSAYQIWRATWTHYGYWDCVYTMAGALVGSAQCGDTGCIRGGEVVDVAAVCPDAPFGPNLCPADAGAD